ncbi:hypothetical protein HELRODRAFT_188931 [Helobdella robusta]|uniref:Transcription initiation factor TFIID subunit 5 n=1 Tax=Helobdella robusta TaxID=6412 RepID=T1FQH8_HELRO|nr:hypothetical protein HELRODRAFT_188931 [Helobdella robusta]ESN98858.1 hypothetical protein HELRODRAFT_188931 [Helobdella robusta]
MGKTFPGTEPITGTEILSGTKTGTEPKYILLVEPKPKTGTKKITRKFNLKEVVYFLQAELGLRLKQHELLHADSLVDIVSRSKSHTDLYVGSSLAEIKKEVNKTKVLYGLLKEPEFNIPLDDDDEEDESFNNASFNHNEDLKPPKKKKLKRDMLLTKKPKNDPNSPPQNRIPLPELRDIDKSERIRAMRELARKVPLGPDSMPTICFFTFINPSQSVTSLEISEDSSLISAGFADSTIRVWSVNSNNKLYSLKHPDELELLDKESDDIMERAMDEKSGKDCRLLCGHSGPVYSASFSPDRTQIISGSEDGSGVMIIKILNLDDSVRLWSMLTWSNLVCFRGHMYPVWDAKFSPLGQYFASCGQDKTARVWSTDHYQPLRLFVGHQSDVTSVEFHPNCNYVATGSADRTVRLWDMLNGSCVRIMTGHQATIDVLKFSSCGRYLASAGRDNKIFIWDLSNGESALNMLGHNRAVKCVSFSRDSTVLASGGMDGMVKIWDINKINSSSSDYNNSANKNQTKSAELGSFRTKSSLVLNVHFTRKNLLLAAGPCVHSDKSRQL